MVDQPIDICRQHDVSLHLHRGFVALRQALNNRQWRLLADMQGQVWRVLQRRPFEQTRRGDATRQLQLSPADLHCAVLLAP